MFNLEEITTSDGLIHQGIIAYPEQPGNTALIWIHGLTGSFYSSTKLLTCLSQEMTKNGIAFASFNNRGHDMIAGFRRMDPKDPKGYTYKTIGGGYEDFEECIYDIDGVISFLHTKGYKKIILAGHSSGANKVCYYAGTIKSPALLGVLLECPMSDRLDFDISSQQIEENVKKCRSLIDQERGDALVTGIHYFPMTAARYISLVSANTSEDQFGYGDMPPTMKQYQQISVPLCVIFAEKDEHADRPINEIRNIFDQQQKSSHYISLILPESFHNLAKQEIKLTQEIISFVKKIA